MGTTEGYSLLGTVGTDGQSVFIDIDRSKGATYEGEGTHEMVHAEQFEDGKFVFAKGPNGWGTSGMTKGFELEAYTKQFIPHPEVKGSISEMSVEIAKRYPDFANAPQDFSADGIKNRLILKTDTFFGVIYPKVKP